jgi:hypothetical protein
MALIFGPLLLNIFNIEFDNKNLKDSFDKIRFWGIPFCILMTLFGTINPNETPRGRMVVVILILGISLIAFIFMVMFNWGGGCDWTNRKVLYVNAENKAIKVVVRENGCGALDSSPPAIHYFKIKSINKNFIIAKPINIKTLDTKKWIKTGDFNLDLNKNIK